MSDDTLDPALLIVTAGREMAAEGLKPGTAASELQRRVDAAISAHTIRELSKRITALERQTAGMQKALDHTESHALTFHGTWQAAASYPPGCVVRHRGAVFTALRQIHPGKAEPGRDGSGWDLIV